MIGAYLLRSSLSHTSYFITVHGPGSEENALVRNCTTLELKNPSAKAATKQSSSIVLVEKMSFSDSDSDIEELSIVSDSEIEEMFEKLNFKAVAPIQRAPKERGSVYMAEQPLAGNRLLNAVGKHRKVVVKRPNGEAKVLENANAMPDGIFGRAKVFKSKSMCLKMLFHFFENKKF